MSVQTPNSQPRRRLLMSMAMALGLTIGGAVIASAATGNSTVPPSAVVKTPVTADAPEKNDVADSPEANDAADEVDGANEVDDVDCEDGIDSKTGAECDGGPDANETHGADEATEAGK